MFFRKRAHNQNNLRNFAADFVRTGGRKSPLLIGTKDYGKQSKKHDYDRQNARTERNR